MKEFKNQLLNATCGRMGAGINSHRIGCLDSDMQKIVVVALLVVTGHIICSSGQ